MKNIYYKCPEQQEPLRIKSYINGDNIVKKVCKLNETVNGIKPAPKETTIVFCDKKPPATNGGSCQRKHWTIRELNSTDYLDGDYFGTLSENIITLEPGIYNINVCTAFCKTGFVKIRIRNIENDYVYMESINHYISNYFVTCEHIACEGKIKVLDPVKIVLEYFCENNVKTIGLGMASGDDDEEVYTKMIVKKMR